MKENNSKRSLYYMRSFAIEHECEGNPRPLDPKIDAMWIGTIAKQHLKNSRTAGEHQTEGDFFICEGERLHHNLTEVNDDIFCKITNVLVSLTQ